MKYEWHYRFIDLAKLAATWSKDPSTKVGAVIVGTNNIPITISCNGFPRTIIDSEERFNNRELKYQIVQHAEANAINNCSYVGVSTKDCIMYLSAFPCAQCAGHIIQAGIAEIIVDKETVHQPYFIKWKDSIELSKLILSEANVKFKFI